jgi:hypothetical protein
VHTAAADADATTAAVFRITASAAFDVMLT